MVPSIDLFPPLHTVSRSKTANPKAPLKTPTTHLLMYSSHTHHCRAFHVTSVFPHCTVAVMVTGDRPTIYGAQCTAIEKESYVSTEPAPSAWANKALRITGPLMDGFFVRVMVVLNQAAWAEKKGVPFFVDYNVSTDPYGGGVLSGWEQYFGRLAVGVGSLGGGDTGGGDNGRGSYKLVDSRVLELDCAAAWENFHSAPCIYCGSQKKALPARTLRAEQMKKWVHIRPAVSALADQVWTKATAGMAAGVPILGVHLRGTDKFLKQKVEPEQYYPFVDGWFKKHPTSRVFVATDDSTYLAKFVARYGPALVVGQGDVIRGSSENGGPNPHQTTSTSTSEAFKKGCQVLVDSICLSKASFLVKSASAVSEFAIYWNMDLMQNSYDFDLWDSPKPAWFDDQVGPPKLGGVDVEQGAGGGQGQEHARGGERAGVSGDTEGKQTAGVEGVEGGEGAAKEAEETRTREDARTGGEARTREETRTREKAGAQPVAPVAPMDQRVPTKKSDFDAGKMAAAASTHVRTEPSGPLDEGAPPGPPPPPPAAGGSPERSAGFVTQLILGAWLLGTVACVCSRRRRPHGLLGQQGKLASPSSAQRSTGEPAKPRRQAGR